MSNRNTDLFDKLFGGVAGGPSSPTAEFRLKIALERIVTLEAAEVYANNAREKLVRRATYTADCAYNKGVADAVRLLGYSKDAAAEIVKAPRHADEFRKP